ncbi:proclotting enzyme [Drosophila novamexicana]|uniref:proclotting enzyme n=1 Tax=Drosophila novamexicana TaxID=47314 RepID=UPI0011E601C5|nr:proclotting enzyme [Drosophila novamexicana]
MSTQLPLLLVAMVLMASVAQRLPENSCAQYFQYVQNGIGSYQGEVTLALQNGRNRIDVRFSMRGIVDVTVFGALQPYPDEATVRASLVAAKFRLSLWPDASGVLPKLTRLAFNDFTLCTASEYDPPTSFFNRFYEFHINTLPSPRWLVPTPVGQTFSRGQTDVEIKTVIFDGSEEAIAHILSDFVNEQRSTTAAAWSPWPTATVGSTTSAVFRQSWPPPTTPTVPIAAPAPWPLATPAPPLIPTANWLNPKALPSPSAPKSTFECGQDDTLVPFIQRGEGYPRGRFPWLTAVYYKQSFSFDFKCGGSLVSTSIVITAAHCVYNVKEDRVRVGVGRYDLRDDKEEGAEARDVSRIKVHPEFSLRVQLQPDSDIALLTLETPVIFNDIISPICLWEAAGNEIAAEVGSIAGWGTDEKGNDVTRYPHVVEAKIASEADCANSWNGQRVLVRTLCASNLDGSGPCLGDSGGGLMVKYNNRWLLRAVVSQGKRSPTEYCNHTVYVLYCDLAKHMTWISQNIN